MKRFFVVRSNSYEGDEGYNVHLFTFGEGKKPCFNFQDNVLDWCNCEAISSIPSIYLPKINALDLVVEVNADFNLINGQDWEEIYL